MNKRQMMTGNVIAGLGLLLCACATPKPGLNYEHAGNAIRAAEIAGATTYAPDELLVAEQHFRKAETLIRHNRPDRAQKLLQLTIAQAELAKAISEAEHAEDAMLQIQAAR